MRSLRIGLSAFAVAAIGVAAVLWFKRRQSVRPRGVIHMGEARSDGRGGGSAVLSVKFGHTGTEVRLDERYGLASEWAAAPTWQELITHEGAERFRDLLRVAPRVRGSSLRLYRGRLHEGTQRASKCMGPPKDRTKIDEGRYNGKGQIVLYLCDQEYGVFRELKADRLDIQRFALPVDALKILDVTILPADHFLRQAFSLAEECMVEDRGPKSYFFSQTLAELVAGQFDGMRVPGVQGNAGAHYSNVIIFRPTSWSDWLEPGADPYVADRS